MSKANYQPTETKPQTIILKAGCWIQTGIGILQTNQEIEVEGFPIFYSNDELRGYRFTCSMYSGVTYDLERVVI